MLHRTRIVIELDYHPKTDHAKRTVKQMVAQALEMHPNTRYRRVKLMEFGAVVGAAVRQSQDRTALLRLADWVLGRKRS
jgi:hypothetical protein